jgi:hypothetical protein
MIDLRGPRVFRWISEREYLPPAGRGVVLSLTPTSADLNAAPGTMSNSSIAYLTSTMHDG